MRVVPQPRGWASGVAAPRGWPVVRQLRWWASGATTPWVGEWCRSPVRWASGAATPPMNELKRLHRPTATTNVSVTSTLLFGQGLN